MKRLLPFLLAVACGGPSAQKAVESPIAKDQRHPTEAPPASTSDVDRSRLQGTFDDMTTTQEAYREAHQGSGAGAGSGSAAATKSSGYPPRFPAKQPPKKTGPAEEAPKQ